MPRDPEVYVLIFRDQNGHSAEVFESMQNARLRVADIIMDEYREYEKHYGQMDPEVKKEILAIFKINDLEKMAGTYDELRRRNDIGDRSERMLAVKAPFVRQQ